MCSSVKVCQTHFYRGVKNFLGEDSLPLRPPSYGPDYKDLNLSRQRHSKQHTYPRQWHSEQHTHPVNTTVNNTLTPPTTQRSSSGTRSGILSSKQRPENLLRTNSRECSASKVETNRRAVILSLIWTSRKCFAIALSQSSRKPADTLHRRRQWLLSMFPLRRATATRPFARWNLILAHLRRS